MIALGVILGLITAWGHTLAYLASRWFTVGGRGTSRELLIVAHVQMGLAAAVALPLAWPGGLAWSWDWGVPVLTAAGCFAVGQACLLAALRRADASVVSPLLSVKIAVLAAATALGVYGPAQPVSPLQWAGVGLAIAGAWLIQGVGRRPPRRAVAWVAGALLGYAFSDLSIVATIRAVRAAVPDGVETTGGGLGALHASVFAATLIYSAVGALALLAWPWGGSQSPRVWVSALPFSAAWMTAMLGLYGAFALLGVVYGAILQSTRALWSVLLGGAIGKLGDGRVETNHHVGVLAWRVAAAAMLVAAVALYAVATARGSGL